MKRKTYVILPLVGAAIGGSLVAIKMFKMNDKVQQASDKYRLLFLMMNQWINIKQEKKSLVDYMMMMGYKNIAIYGAGYAGKTLLKELEDSPIHVNYVIDMGNTAVENCRVYTLRDELPNVDAVVVTPIYYYDEIEKNLSQKLNCPLLSLDDVLYRI